MRPGLAVAPPIVPRHLVPRHLVPRIPVPHLLVALVAALVILTPASARAGRPFVSEDAWLDDPGQLSVETWFVLSREDSRVLVVYNALGELVLLDWLALGLEGGVGLDVDDTITVANPGAYIKTVYRAPETDGPPGVGLLLGGNLPVGRGTAHSSATGLYAIVPINFVVAGGVAEIYVNLGWRLSLQSRDLVVNEPFWGLGTEIALGATNFAWMIEAFSGDPIDPLGPPLGAQSGLRWAPLEWLQFDAALLAYAAIDDDRERTGELDWNVHFGASFVFDLFSRRAADEAEETAAVPPRMPPGPGGRSSLPRTGRSR